ncbi:MAG TPA: hypothetical protein VL096_12640, partial [Pirellulaceae bacterium]|nr:hypothetical protein [Pirellulaceae bacterium]
AVTNDDVKLRLQPAKLNARFLQAYGELEEFSSTDSAERQLNHGFGLHRQTVAEKPGIVTFDLADAIYLRSRCQQHLGECELALAYAAPELCQFAQMRSFELPPGGYIIKLHELQRDPAFGGEEELNQRMVAGLLPASYFRDWIDKLAARHTFKQELVAPERMPRALQHFQAAVDMELQAIDAVRAEKDDDCEWRPNARQKHCVIYHPRRHGRESARPRNPSRRAELVELQSLLAGKTLLPHHRVSDTVGINLTKIFNEPVSFDAILWHHGCGATNYLETGEITPWQPDFTLHHDDFFFRQWMYAATREGGQW